MKIGIVGQGYVGTAVKEVFSKHYDVETYDLDKDKCSVDYLEDIVELSNIIFVCVPTPMKKDGSCDTSIVEAIVKDINDMVVSRNVSGRIVAIKSTIPPGTTNKLNKECENISVLFNPEFLTEANFIEDFRNQNRIIIGGPRPSTTILRQVYSLVFPNVSIIKTGSKTAEMVKYMTNTFLATKVSFANEMKMVCDKLDIDYDKVVEYSTYDERLGKSHWAVPGPDGKMGFGGSCFPKDINALLDVCRQLGVTATTLFGAWQTNEKVRPEKDWELLKGRAVVDEE
jgi:UDPglucose 6-dehydrogenase